MNMKSYLFSMLALSALISCSKKLDEPQAPTQKVDADVAAQPVEPRGKRRRKLILVKTAPRPQKRLLRQIHRVVRVPRHAIA